MCLRVGSPGFCPVFDSKMCSSVSTGEHRVQTDKAHQGDIFFGEMTTFLPGPTKGDTGAFWVSEEAQKQASPL